MPYKEEDPRCRECPAKEECKARGRMVCQECHVPECTSGDCPRACNAL